MKKVKKGIIFILKWVLGIVTFFVVYAAIIFLLSRITVNANEQNAAQDVSIYIKTNGVHTDIVVPIKNEIKDWSSEISVDHTVSKNHNFQFIGFGWGDKGFYLNTPQWSDLKVSTALNAMFYLGTSAMHATFYNEMHESQSCIKINISKKEYAQLVAYINQGFQNGKVTLIPNAHYADNDSFYEGNGKYSLFYTCNSWANNALKAANQKAALWTLSDTGIFCHYAVTE